MSPEANLLERSAAPTGNEDLLGIGAHRSWAGSLVGPTHRARLHAVLRPANHYRLNVLRGLDGGVWRPRNGVEAVILVALVVVLVALVATVVSSATATHTPKASSAEAWNDSTATVDLGYLSNAFFVVAHTNPDMTTATCENVTSAVASLRSHVALPHGRDQKALLKGLVDIDGHLSGCTALAQLDAAGTPPPRNQNEFTFYYSFGWGEVRHALASAGLKVPMMTQPKTD